MFPGGFGVGLTVADLAPPPPGFGPPIAESPALADVLPVHARTAAEKAAELQRVGQLKAALAAYEVALVAAFAADRPAFLDRRPGHPGAATEDDATPKLARGRLDWPCARTLAEELGEKVRGTDPVVLARVEAAVLPEAAGLSIRRLTDRLRAALAARDAAAGDRARQDAHQAVTVRRRPVGDGVSELIAGMPDELAAAGQATIDELARRVQQAGDDRPIGMLRSGVLADLILRPWAVPEPVAAHLEVQVPLGALTSEGFLAGGAPAPPVLVRPGAVAQPTGAVAGVPIPAAHVRDLLAQLDAVGLQTPPGRSIGFSVTDGHGTLRAVATLRELRAAAVRPTRRPTAVVRSSSGRRRPAPTHPPPHSGGSSAPWTAPAATPAAPTAPGGPTPTTSSRTPAAAPPTAPTCQVADASSPGVKMPR